MLSKKVKEVKSLKRDSEIYYNKFEVELSSLRKKLRKEFQDALKRKIKKALKIKFGNFDFGLKKNNQDPAIIKILFVNDAWATLDNAWCDDDGVDVSHLIPVSVDWLENFCQEQTEKLGIKIEIEKKEKIK